MTWQMMYLCIMYIILAYIVVYINETLTDLINTRRKKPEKNTVIVHLHFSFWISLSLRPKTETKRLNFGLSWS